MAKKIDKRSKVKMEEAKKILKEAEDALKMGKDDFEVYLFIYLFLRILPLSRPLTQTQTFLI